MKRRIVAAVIAASAVVLTGVSTPSASSTPVRTALATHALTVATIPRVASVSVRVEPAPIKVAPAPARASARPASAVRATVRASAPATTTATARSTTPAARAAYVNAMYRSVVPAGQRAALAGHYVLGYNLAGLACGTGCTGIFDGQARSSFNNTFFTESLAYQRNRVAHEAAHAYGFLFITSYATPSWATAGGWQAKFHILDRSFVRTYDAEAWASCVAWKESGFNNRVDQITAVYTPQAATAAMAQIP